MMNRFTTACLVALLAGFVTVPAVAQHTGVYPVEQLGILDPGTLEVDVNLEGSTLQIAVGALEDEDPKLIELVSNLSRVRVQVGSTVGTDPSRVAERLAGAAAQLEAQGWARIVRVEDGSDRVYVYSIDGGDGSIAGLTALITEGDGEAVVANVAGRIDPVLLGSVLSRLGEMDLDQLVAMGDTDD